MIYSAKMDNFDIIFAIIDYYLKIFPNHGGLIECDYSYLRLLLFGNIFNHVELMECDFSHLRLLHYQNFPTMVDYLNVILAI